MNTKEIKKITFSLFSEEEILEISRYEVNLSKHSDKKFNTVYDPRGGASFNKNCITCKQTDKECPGHFGHIKLNKRVVYPIYIPFVLNILKIICYNCSNFLLSSEQILNLDLKKYKSEKKIFELILKTKKITNCFNCKASKREYKLQKESDINNIVYDDNRIISDEEIYEILSDISDKTVEILNISHPKNFCIKNLLVIPACCRPYEIINNSLKEDDLTKIYIDILKSNTLIMENGLTNLKLKIELLCRNTKNKNRNNNGELTKGIKEILSGKDGQLRDILCGKRTGHSARTVIGPGPHLKVDEVGVPRYIAQILSIPIKVNKYNINYINELLEKDLITKLVRNDNSFRIDIEKYFDISNFLKINDIIYRNNKIFKVKNTNLILKEGDKIFRDGKDITPDQLPKVRKIDIQYGDIVHRMLQDGDWVLMNRQPTLWKGSMMSFKIKIHNCKTFQLNLAVCKAFNADFDGDEQNLHIPQFLESSIEIRNLSNPGECILNCRNGEPMIIILQDSLVGAYLMSTSDFSLSKGQVYNIIMHLSLGTDYYLKNLNRIKKNFTSYNGKLLLSLILPDTLNLNEDDLKIKNGIIIEGILNKKYLSSSKKSLILKIKLEYGTNICMNFINDIQFITNQWLLLHSFSINIKDFFPHDFSSEIYDKIKEAEFISKTIKNKILSEMKINVILSNAKDIGVSVINVYKQQKEDNNFVTAILSGSKGDPLNLAQNKVALGQQIIEGERLKYCMDNETRSLLYYPKDEKKMSLKQKYESRGFIFNGYMKGLSPIEFLIHAKSGRESVCEKSTKTYEPGYVNRKLREINKDIKINNQGIVEDDNKNNYMFSYGEYGENPEYSNIDLDSIVKKYTL